MTIKRRYDIIDSNGKVDEIMDNPSILEYVSFHDERLLKLEINGNNLMINATDDLGDNYTIYINNARITSDSGVDIRDTVGRIIITLSYHESDDKENYIHLEVVGNNVIFDDEFYIYSNDITVSKNT